MRHSSQRAANHTSNGLRILLTAWSNSIWTILFYFFFHFIFFAVKFTAIFCRNWSASIDPFSLSFHKQFRPKCTCRATIFQWRRQNRREKLVNLIFTYAPIDDACAYCAWHVRRTVSWPLKKGFHIFFLPTSRFWLSMVAACCHPFPECATENEVFKNLIWNMEFEYKNAIKLEYLPTRSGGGGGSGSGNHPISTFI